MWKGDDSGVTGRVGLFAETLKLVGGYGEGFPYPRGGQDVELPQRVGAVTGKPIPRNSKTKLLTPPNTYGIDRRLETQFIVEEKTAHNSASRTLQCPVMAGALSCQQQLSYSL